MLFLIFFIKSVRPGKKQRQFIDVQPAGTVVFILPDETALLAVLRDGPVSQELFIFIDGIQIKQKQAARIQVVVDQAEDLQQILFLRDIIHGVADADHRPHGPVKLKLPHILQQIENIQGLFPRLLHGFLEHSRGVVHANHVIPCPGQAHGQASGSASQFQNQSVPDALLPQKPDDITAPGIIIHITHEQVIDSGKFSVCFHQLFPPCSSSTNCGSSE